MPSLLAGLKAVCAAFPDTRKGRGGNIAMADFGLSAFAMFFMQSASFLAFQRALEKGQGRSNCQSLFGIEQNSLRQLYPRHAGRSRPGTSCALLRTSGNAAGRAAFAAGLWSVGWQNTRRLGWNRVFLLAKARLPELPHPQALQRQDRELSLPCCRRRSWRPAIPKSFL